MLAENIISLYGKDEIEFEEPDNATHAKDDTANDIRLEKKDSINEYKHLRERKWRYLFYDICKNNKITVGICGERNNTFDDLLKDKEPTKDQPCWMVYDLEYTKEDHGVF